MRIFVFNLLLLIGIATSTAAIATQSTSQARAISIADSLHEKAQYHYSQRNFAKAISDCREALSIYEQQLGKESTQYATSFYVLSIFYAMNNNVTEAIETGVEAKQLFSKIFGRNSNTYIISLTSLAISYSNGKMYDKAIETQSELVDLLKSSEKPLNEYIEALNRLAEFYHHDGKYMKAISIREESLSCCKRLSGKRTTTEVDILSDLSIEYYYSSNCRKAIEIGTTVAEMTKRISGENSAQHANAINNLANFHSENGNNNEALRLHKHALEIIRNTNGPNSAEYAGKLSTLASSYARIGNTTEAIATNLKALEILRHSDHEPTLYIYTLSNHAQYLIDLGDYDEADRYSTEAYNAAVSEFGKYHPQTAKTIGKRALAKYHANKLDEAIALECEVTEIIKATLGTKHNQYISSISSLAAYYSRSKNVEKSIELTTEALNIQAELNGKDNVLYATILSNLAIEMSTAGDYKRAIALDKEAATIFAKATGKRHPDYGSIVMNTAVHSLSANDYDNFIKAANEYTLLATDIVCQTFANLTSSERNLFWSKYSHWYTNFAHKAALTMPTKDAISNAYNCSLFAKGLLLNSEIEMRRLLILSGDEQLISLYDNMQSDRHWLNQLYTKPVSEREYSTDSLEQAITLAERRLIAESKTYGDFTRNLYINWKDVRDNLGDRDIAIEFVSFPIKQDSTVYAAYILKKDFSEPKMVTFTDMPTSKSLNNAAIYTSTSLSQKIWGKLSTYLKGTKNVFFSPAGALYNIAIESLPHWEHPQTTISEHLTLYRVSSTRQLANRQQRHKITSAATFGGLKYDTDTASLISNSRQYAQRDVSLIQSNSSNDLDLRGSVEYLPATLSEANNINNSLTASNISNLLFTGKQGTEASFKNLSGQHKNLLHIATHGFYWTEREARRMNDVSFLRVESNTLRRHAEDKALNRSGLLLAGANHTLSGEKLPGDIDDGILTAREIAQLDFNGLELVVLSACQTGMGEITSEGVFGLQRGFKKAGANAILMSLWKVDDNATSLLMTEFYKNWTSGLTLHQSLETAKNTLRSTPRFSDPTFWAAFILLDGINQIHK